MKKINQNIYPPKGRIYFDGGKNNAYERAYIADNESPDCLNVIFDNGSVQTRGGSQKFNTTTVGSYVCDGLYTRHDNVGVQTMCAWFNGTLYTWNATTFASITSSKSIYTAGTRVYAAEYENYIFFCNGSNTPYKYGGTSDTFTRHGVPAPTTTMTVATAGTGAALSGTYQYAYTYVNSNLVEGDLSPIGGPITLAGKNAALTGISVAPVSFGVESRRIYRTSGTTYFRIATLNDNTTTTYEDAITTTGAEAPDDNGVPPNYSAIVYHQARLFCIDPTTNLIKYSELGNPYTFASTSFLRVGDNTFDIPKSLAVYDNSIVVFCVNNPWIIYMPDTTPGNWTIHRVRANYGTKSPFGHFKFNNKIMFPAIENDKLVGFAAIEGQTLAPSASLLTNSAIQSDMQSDKIDPDVFNIQEAYCSNIASIVYKSRGYTAVTYGDGQTTNNRIYVFDFERSRAKEQANSWVPWTGINANAFTILDGVLYCGTSTANGYVWELNTDTYADDGTAINSYYWTKEFSGLNSEENIFKDFRYAQIFYEKSGDWNMGFTKRIDSDTGSGETQNIDLNPGGSLWGTMVWNRDNWGGGTSEGEDRVFLSPSRGKRIQFKFDNKNTVSSKFKVLGMQFVYNNKGMR
jgi:hypothetical protein